MCSNLSDALAVKVLKVYTGRRVRKLCLPWALRTIGMALLTVSTLLPAAAQVKPVRRVLVFNDFGSVSSPGIAEMDREIFDGLQNSSYMVEFYNENLEVTLFPEEASQHQAREWYILKYSDRRPDVIITVGPASLRFMQEMHEGPFEDTPVVFCGIMEIPAGLDSRFTGAWSSVQTGKTMESALRLQPNTRHVVVVGGVGSLDREGEAIVRKNLRGYESRFDFTYLTDLSMPDLLEQLKLLPNDTIVLHTAITQDTAGNRFIDATQAVPLVAGAARAPVFVLDDVDLNNGAVGGDLLSWAATARDAAKSALRILNGEKPQDIPIVRSDNVYMFDWRALRRWGLKESNLPPGSTILNRQPTLWESYRWYVIGGMTLMLVEALLISELLWQRIRRKAAETKLIIANKQLEADIADRKRAEATLRESEERFRLVANTAPVMIWMSGQDKLYTYFNQSWLEFTGRSLREELGNGWAEGVHPEDLAPCLGTYEQAFDRCETFRVQYRLRRHDGEYRWVFDQGVPRFNADGSFAGFIGSCIDITERKLADEALAGMSRKLLEAQEQERARIGRELHDDINQRLALLSVEIQRMKEVSPSTYGELRSRMDELGKRTSEISTVVQSLSHELHSSRLEYLGLVSAMKSFCKEFGDKHKVEIDFSSEGIPSGIPPEISLCLFRVMQEGLQNALKHSGVRFFEVKLLGSPTEIRLTVRDSGAGFEPELAKDTPGLGLVSMQERVRLVKGTFLITSRPQSGTQINVRIPVSTGEQTKQAKLARA
jgi:PAS domain S-box-containing protein